MMLDHSRDTKKLFHFKQSNNNVLMMNKSQILLCALVVVLLTSLFGCYVFGSNYKEMHSQELCLNEDSLDGIVGCLLINMPQQPLVDYTSPTPTKSEWDAWGQLIDSMTRLGSHTACNELNAQIGVLEQSYSIQSVIQEEAEFCVALPKRLTLGWPSFFVKIGSARLHTHLHLSVAHPVTDGDVAQQGAYILQHSDVAKSLLIAGTTRNASIAMSACQPGNYETDAAHNVNSLFQKTIVQLHDSYLTRGNFDQLLCIQLHGMAETSCHDVTAFMSNGVTITDINHPENTNLRLLKAAISELRRDWNVTSTESHTCNLSGNSNVQGRVLNQNTTVANEPNDLFCTLKAHQATGTFIHIEQKRVSRDAHKSWTQAINIAYAPQPAQSTNPHSSSSSGAVSIAVTFPVIIWVLTVAAILIIR